MWNIKGGTQANGIWKQVPDASIWAQVNENGEKKRLHNEKFHSLYRSPNMKRVIKSRTLKMDRACSQNGRRQDCFRQVNQQERDFWSAIHNYLFNVFAVMLHIWRPTPPSATQRGCTMPWWTHRWEIYKTYNESNKKTWDLIRCIAPCPQSTDNKNYFFITDFCSVKIPRLGIGYSCQSKTSSGREQLVETRPNEEMYFSSYFFQTWHSNLLGLYLVC